MKRSNEKEGFHEAADSYDVVASFISCRMNSAAALMGKLVEQREIPEMCAASQLKAHPDSILYTSYGV